MINMIQNAEKCCLDLNGGSVEREGLDIGCSRCAGHHSVCVCVCVCVSKQVLFDIVLM